MMLTITFSFGSFFLAGFFLFAVLEVFMDLDLFSRFIQRAKDILRLGQFVFLLERTDALGLTPMTPFRVFDVFVWELLYSLDRFSELRYPTSKLSD